MIEPPFYPIIYVRGYAGTQGEVEDTVATPFMGFNLGSTKIRQRYTGEMLAHVFESPLIRLMKDYQYVDAYHHGQLLPKGPIPSRSIWIFRYSISPPKNWERGSARKSNSTLRSFATSFFMCEGLFLSRARIPGAFGRISWPTLWEGLSVAATFKTALSAAWTDTPLLAGKKKALISSLHTPHLTVASSFGEVWDGWRGYVTSLTQITQETLARHGCANSLTFPVGSLLTRFMDAIRRIGSSV